MPLLANAEGEVDYRLTGRGRPVTVFAHGLGASIDETRTLASGVPGTRVFLHFRAHGPSPDPGTPWTYASLAAQLRAVADAVGATQALGVSMGAAALVRLLLDTPDRFSRAVFFLPAVLDARDGDAQARLASLAVGVVAGDVAGIAALLLEDQAPAVRALPAARAWARAQAARLAGTGAGAAVRGLAGELPVSDRAELAALRLPCLVIGQELDRAHPAAVARQLAAALPCARLEIFAAGSAMWLSRPRVRALLSDFLGDATGC